MLSVSPVWTFSTYIVGEKSILRTTQGKVFDKMYANYTFEIYIKSYTKYNSVFKYTHDSGDYYNVTWWISGYGTNTWLENKQTRLTSNSSGGLSFGNGVHAPIWLFTDLTVGDIILIAVDARGDQIFNVTRELTHNHPIYGLMNIFVLQSLVFPLSVVWYERSTGILLNGTFMHTLGLSNYNLTLTDTNIFSYYQAFYGETPPLYILFIVIGITGIITIVILRKRKPLS